MSDGNFFNLPPQFVTGFIVIYVIILVYINSMGLPKSLAKYGDLAYYLIVGLPALLILINEHQRINTNILFSKIGQIIFKLMCVFRDLMYKVQKFVDYDVKRTTKLIWVLLFLQLLYLGVYFFKPYFEKWYYAKNNNIADRDKAEKEMELHEEMKYFVNLGEQRNKLMDGIKPEVWKTAKKIMDGDLIASGDADGLTNEEILKIYLNAKKYSDDNVKSFSSLFKHKGSKLKNTLEILQGKKALTKMDTINFWRESKAFVNLSRVDQANNSSTFNKAFEKIKGRYQKIHDIGDKMRDSKRKINDLKREINTTYAQKSKPYVFVKNPHTTKKKISLKDRSTLTNGDVNIFYRDLDEANKTVLSSGSEENEENDKIRRRARMDLSKNTFQIGTNKSEYCLTMWFYVNGDVRRTSRGKKQIFTFDDRPKILYDAGENKIDIQVRGNTDISIIIERIPYQRWNYLVINMKHPRVDVFLNGKLMASEIKPLKTQTSEGIHLGDENGHLIDVCNLTYYHIPLNLKEIKNYYNALKDRDVPLF